MRRSRTLLATLRGLRLARGARGPLALAVFLAFAIGSSAAPPPQLTATAPSPVAAPAESAAAPTAAAPAGRRMPSVAFAAPAPDEPLVGVVDIRLRIDNAGSAVDRVEIYLDGLLAITLLKAPWHAQVDVGPELQSHNLEAVVHNRRGQTATARLSAAPLRTDLEIAVRLQPVFVRVQRDGRPARALQREHFTVYDDGVAQELVTFEYGSVPFSAVLLVDASTSMVGDRLRAAIAGAESFTRALQPLDQTKLMVFADRLVHETPFTNLPAILTLGLGSLEARGGSAITDALALGYARLAPERGRRVVLLLSDGLDVDSVLEMQTVRGIARRTQSVVYWLRTGSTADEVAYTTLWRTPDLNTKNLRALSDLVAETGGRIFEVPRPEGVGARLAEVLAELREQFVLGFYPSPLRGSGTWHNLRVEVRGGGDVRTQQGYSEP